MNKFDLAAIVLGASAAGAFWSCGSRSETRDASVPDDAVVADGPSDAPPDAPPPPPWEHPWDVALGALTVHSTECADWEDVTRPPELAEDPTPRELWRFRVADDPMGMSFGANLWKPSLHPDQRTILTHGPEDDAIIAIRDGRIIGRRDVVRIDGFFAFAPDGTAFARRYDPGYASSEDVLQRVILHEEPTRVRIEVQPVYTFERGVYGEAVAVGSGGRVFLEARTLTRGGGTLKIYAFCRGETVLWEREMLVRPRRGAGATLRVDSSQRLHVSVTTLGESFDSSGYFSSTWVLSLDGDLLEVIPEAPTPSEERALYEEVGLLGDTRATLERIDDRPIVSEFGANRATTRYFADDLVPRHLFAADGAIWIETIRGMTRHFAGDVREVSFGDGSRFWPILPDPDGGALVTQFRQANPSAPLEFLSTRRLDASGEVVWDLPMRMGGEPLHANDGVLYVVGSNYVAAWQLDFLPMPHACLSPRFGCNAQRDGWVRPPPAEPATLAR